MSPSDLPEIVQSRRMLDVLIRAGLVTVLALFCYRVFQPFLNLMLWAVILAVTFYPLQCLLKTRLGLRDGYAATLITVVSVLVLMVPVSLLGASIADSVDRALELLKGGDLHIPPPPASVATWPLVGQSLFDLWQQASTDLTSLLKKVLPLMKDFGMPLMRQLAGVGAAFLMFIGALIIAGIIMAFGETGTLSAVRIASRLTGPERGPHLVELCSSTIRAVAQGVVGIAFIQMLLIGVGFVVKGITGAGLLALGVLLLGILQLPATLITLPVIAYVFITDGATVASFVFAIYTFVAGLVDNVLKPLMLGRGVEVPMPVILIGALGGMVTGGIIGLFIGPVFLAVGYQLFWQWVNQQLPETPATDEASETATDESRTG